MCYQHRHTFESWCHREGWIKIENKVGLRIEHWGTTALMQMDPLEWPFKITFISRFEIWSFSPICNLVYHTSCTTSFLYLWQMNDFRKKVTLIHSHKCAKQLKISISKYISDVNVVIIRCIAKTISLRPRVSFKKYLILLSFG